MGRKKSFIDKKKATTYNLIYRSTEDADDEPERMLVEADKLGKIEEDDDYLDLPMSSNARFVVHVPCNLEFPRVFCTAVGGNAQPTSMVSQLFLE